MQSNTVLNQPSNQGSSSRTKELPFTLKDVKDAIPAHCFEPSAWKSLSYFFLDLGIIAGLYAIAYSLDSWLFYPIFWLMLLGIWMLGPLCIMFANTTPTHGGFTVPGTGWVVLLGAVTVVPVTLFMSLMSGDLFVLALVTVLFNLLALADLMGYRVTISQKGITWEKGSVRSNDTTLL